MNSNSHSHAVIAYLCKSTLDRISDSSTQVQHVTLLVSTFLTRPNRIRRCHNHDVS